MLLGLSLRVKCTIDVGTIPSIKMHHVGTLICNDLFCWGWKMIVWQKQAGAALGQAQLKLELDLT